MTSDIKNCHIDPFKNIQSKYETKEDNGMDKKIENIK